MLNTQPQLCHSVQPRKVPQHGNNVTGITPHSKLDVFLSGKASSALSRADKRGAEHTKKKHVCRSPHNGED